MKIELTPELRKRVKASLNETTLLMRDKSRSLEKRKFYKSHASKLRKFLDQGFVEA